MYIPKELKIRVRETRTREDKLDLITDPYNAINWLAYVTYIDEKGKLRKETSWNGWGDKEIEGIDNKPLEGFRLSGTTSRSSDWFGSGRSMFYVEHPKGFRFEITSNNLLEIISNCTVTNGLINAPCVLAWEGKNLALVSTNTDLYKETVELTDKIESGPLKIKELVIGNHYCDRNGEYAGQYLGRAPVMGYKSDYEGSYGSGRYVYTLIIQTKHIFKTDRTYLNVQVSPKVYDHAEEMPTINFDVDEYNNGESWDNYILRPEDFDKSDEELIALYDKYHNRDYKMDFVDVKRKNKFTSTLK